MLEPAHLPGAPHACYRFSLLRQEDDGLQWERAGSQYLLMLRWVWLTCLSPPLPTGLGVRADSVSGIERIYNIKGRPSNLPLAICVADSSDVGRYAMCQHLAPELLAALLPGPVTILLPRLPNAPLAPELNPGVETIGEHCAPASAHM